MTLDAKESVRAAARSLGYVPHGIARALREGSSRVMVLSIDPGLESSHSRTFAGGLDQELSAHGHMLLVRQAQSAPVPDRQVLVDLDLLATDFRSADRIVQICQALQICDR